ncbi:uncharacterized protein [Miscanthus floridulus]|uniref:uncharacterized protein n=1 Tax=Miscanthus floridulus TaxID=154761 RepID=UPI0034583193
MTWKKLFTIKDPSGGSGGEASFSVTLECTVTKTLKADGHWQSVYLLYEGGSSTRILKWLQQLNLTDEQWKDILPEREVPELMTLACEACQDSCITHAMFERWVDEQFEFIASKELLTLCAEAVAPAGCQDCSIYPHDGTSNPIADDAMEMPGYGHAFHRMYITEWFGRRSTCPMCRLDLATHLDPAVQRFLSHFTEEDY